MARRLTDLDPDGLRIVVPWYTLLPGMSVFVPCINVPRCERQVDAIAHRLQITLTHKRCTWNGYLGLRVWRDT